MTSDLKISGDVVLGGTTPETAEVMCISDEGQLKIFGEEVAVDKDLYDFITRMSPTYSSPIRFELVPESDGKGNQPGEISFTGPASEDAPGKEYLRFRGLTAIIDDQETKDRQAIYRALKAWYEASVVKH